MKKMFYSVKLLAVIVILLSGHSVVRADIVQYSHDETSAYNHVYTGGTSDYSIQMLGTGISGTLTKFTTLWNWYYGSQGNFSYAGRIIECGTESDVESYALYQNTLGAQGSDPISCSLVYRSSGVSNFSSYQGYTKASNPFNHTFDISKYYALFVGGYNPGWGSEIYIRGTNADSFEGELLSHSRASDVSDIWFELIGVNRTATSDFATSTTLTANNSPYIISGNVKVSSGAVLTINEGVRIKFDTATTSSLIVEGTLNIEGGPGSDSVVLTSLLDDSVSGDTNNDGDTTSPSSGDWGGIVINTGGIANIEHAIIRYGGLTGNGLIHNNGGDLEIASSTIVYGDSYGIKNTSGSSTILSSDIGFNDYGVYSNGGTVSISATSTIHDNSLYGVFNSSMSTLNAEGNYWGSSSGPYHSSNSSGTGNAVSNGVDFSPWISVLHYVISELFPSCAPDICSSVNNNQLLVDPNNTQFSTEVSSAISTWSALNGVAITSTSSPSADLKIIDNSSSDTWLKGQWLPSSGQDDLILYSYFLGSDSTAQIQHTITHELGHALGLYHSFTGNVMFVNQTSQTSLGAQDISDYNYLWP